MTALLPPSFCLPTIQLHACLPPPASVTLPEAGEGDVSTKGRSLQTAGSGESRWGGWPHGYSVLGQTHGVTDSAESSRRCIPSGHSTELVHGLSAAPAPRRRRSAALREARPRCARSCRPCEGVAAARRAAPPRRQHHHPPRSPHKLRGPAGAGPGAGGAHGSGSGSGQTALPPPALAAHTPRPSGGWAGSGGGAWVGVGVWAAGTAAAVPTAAPPPGSGGAGGAGRFLRLCGTAPGGRRGRMPASGARAGSLEESGPALRLVLLGGPPGGRLSPSRMVSAPWRPRLAAAG
eukprot:CAMPEP_0198443940 /NCGR_PEP_ID=MMETSP1452-20131203/70353_1 /TAXON_ID=1181717 /ORGANISM="Synchroma pusillum, Strain CCMP3072" /LENGTH=290 /DNA_ID=CAMNT_0044164589 /DNA_START=308 /DNA_END=1176 /DNA_ORIENTATION=-